MVSAGLSAAEDGKKLASTTYRLSWSQARQCGSSTDAAGSVPKRAVPHWCEGVSVPNGLDSTIGKPVSLSSRFATSTHFRCDCKLLRFQLSWIAPSLRRTTLLSRWARSSDITYQSTLWRASQARDHLGALGSAPRSIGSSILPSSCRLPSGLSLASPPK